VVIGGASEGGLLGEVCAPDLLPYMDM